MVELIVVIVILGILAAVALPRFMGLEREARIASLKSMGGTLQSAAQMAHGVCIARNCAPGATLLLEGVSVTFVNTYPSVGSIAALVQSTEGFTVATNVFTRTGAIAAGCSVTYNAATSAAGVITAPTLTYGSTLMNAANEATINTNLHAAC
jgi:MSHA pilin protein MshA